MTKLFLLFAITLLSLSIKTKAQLPSSTNLIGKLSTDCQNLPKFQYTPDSTEIFYLENINLNKPIDTILIAFYQEIYQDNFMLKESNLGFKDMKVTFYNDGIYKKGFLPKVIFGFVNFKTPEGYTTQFSFRIVFSGTSAQIHISGIREYYNKELGAPYLIDLIKLVKSSEAKLKHPDICSRVVDYDNRAKLILDKLKHFLITEAANNKYKPQRFIQIDCY
jgi:hypothetical protein